MPGNEILEEGEGKGGIRKKKCGEVRWIGVPGRWGFFLQSGDYGG